MEVAQLKLPQTQILLAFGTRPEAIKLGPVAAEFKAANVPFGVSVPSKVYCATWARSK